jgi:formate dehydrogenase major subunit
MKHPGTPNLYDTSKHVMDGGGNFRANFGVENEGVSLLAERGLGTPRAPTCTMGYPEFDHVLLKKLGWWDELTEAEKKPKPRARTGRPTPRAASSASP